MFERFTEKARRTIFFARYDASQYGSATIETEHLLLGLLREDHRLILRLLGKNTTAAEIRSEIEKTIVRGERVSTSVEIPLSRECKKILMQAGEEAEHLGHPHVGTEHLLLGLLSEQESLAARLLTAQGVKAASIRELIAKATASASLAPQLALDGFLGCLKEGLPEVLDFFAENGQFVDANGRRWTGREELKKQAEKLFAPFAKRNATHKLEGIMKGPGEAVVAMVLWEFAASLREGSKSILRMSVVMDSRQQQWLIVLVQVTPVATSSEARA